MSASHGPFFIVLNAASGSGDAEQARAIIAEELALAQVRYEFFVAQRGDQVEQLVERAAQHAAEQNGVLVAAGGDGTINSAARAALHVERPLGIVPQGTFNYTTRAHDIPPDTRGAARVLVQGRLRRVQVGLVNEHVFLVNAGVGLHPEILEDREAYKAKFGRHQAVAIGAGIRTLFREHRQLSLQIEHDHQVEPVRTPSLFVGNNTLQLGQAGLDAVEHAVENHRLAAVIVRPVSTWALLGLALRGALGRLGQDEHLHSFPFRSMTVRSNSRRQPRGYKVSMDGEVRWLKAPLRFSVAPRPLQLLVPKKVEAQGAA
jgi:diacylglycerol kinase family enzyme